MERKGTFEKLGKTPHKDAASAKNTHTKIFGIDNSRKELSTLCEKAKDVLQSVDINSPLLCYIAQGLIDKVKGE